MRNALRCRIAVTCMGAALCLAGGTAVAQTAISSTISLKAESSIGAGTVTDTKTDSQGATLNPLSAAVLATATDGTQTVITHGTMTSSFASAAAGTVTATDFGWNVTNVATGSAQLTGGLDWEYKFVAGATGLFTLNYNLTTSGTSIFGLNGIAFYWDGMFTNFFNVSITGSASGSVTQPIVAGSTYTARLLNQANIAGGLGTRDAHMNGNFSFSMPAADVPEPGAYALLMGSLASFGLVLRRKRA